MYIYLYLFLTIKSSNLYIYYFKYIIKETNFTSSFLSKTTRNKPRLCDSLLKIEFWTQASTRDKTKNKKNNNKYKHANDYNNKKKKKKERDVLTRKTKR